MVDSPVQDILDHIHREALGLDEGAVATYIPELAQADPDAFGLALSTLDGALYEAGDAEQPFTIQSVSKPFVMALAIQDRGLDTFLAHVGVEPTGDPFNAVTLEEGTGRPLNPMVNAGAILTTSLVAGEDVPAQSQRVVDGLSAFAGRPLSVDERVLASEIATGDRNRAIAFLMRGMGSFDADVERTLEVYFRQCSVLVTAHDLAVMAGTLASGGRNPLTGELVVSPEVVTNVLSVMVTCGMYDFSGEWMFHTGMPAKSGVGGGIAVVLPGAFGIGTYSPRLDARGNSVRGVAACEELARHFALHLMRPRPPVAPTVRRRLSGSQVRSRRGRHSTERVVIAEHPEAMVVYELQGDLTFAEAEDVARQVAVETPRWLVLDTARVDQVDPVAAQLLDATATRLAAAGVTVLVAGPRKLVDVPIDQSFTTVTEAIESCEDVLVAEAGLPGPEAGVPLGDNDLCRALTDDEVAELQRVGAQLDFAAGDDLTGDGSVAYPIEFITKGQVAIEHHSGPGAVTAYDLDSRVTSRSAGSAVGALSALGVSTASTRFVAETDVSVVALSDEALDGLQQEHPRLAAALFRAVAEAVAAEYRWVLAENAALTR
ncbi:glutaminase A [Monashia sp. NPDC004114]